MSQSDPTVFRSEIAGLRAFAVMSVLIYHANSVWLPGGFVGVDIFFVISGYLISRIILKDVANGSFSITQFYARRIKRILPALLIVLSVVWIYGWFRLFPSHFKDLGRFQNISSFFYLNFMLVGDSDYFDVAAQSKPLLHLWSLSIEEQFYIFWPLLLVGTARFGHRILLMLCALTLSSFIFCIFKTATAPTAAYYLPWTRSWELALGGLVAWREIGSPDFGRTQLDRGKLPLAALGTVLLLAGVCFINQDQPFPGWRAAVPTLGAALLLMLPANALSSILLGNRIGRSIGAISYPLYLWHWPLLAFAHLEWGINLSAFTSGMMLALAALLAVLTWYFIERPTDLLYRDHRRVTVSALFVGLVSVGVLGIATHDTEGFPNRFSSEVTKILNFPNSVWASAAGPASKVSDSAVDCFYGFHRGTDDVAWHTANLLSFYRDKPCFDIKDPSKPTIALVGDSHAAHLSAGLKSVFSDRFNILNFSTFYCIPLIENVSVGNGRAGTGRCQAYNHFVFEKLRQIRPDIVLVGSYFWQYRSDNAWIYPHYPDALNQNATELINSGIGSVLVAGQMPTWSPSLKEVVGREVQSGTNPVIFSFNGVNRDLLTIDSDLKAYPWSKGVHYISMLDTLCRADGCRRLTGSVVPDDLMAIDYGHLSMGGSVFVAREILAKPIVDILIPSHHE